MYQEKARIVYFPKFSASTAYLHTCTCVSINCVSCCFFFHLKILKLKYLKMVVIKKVYGHEHRIMYLTGPKLVSNFCIIIETFKSGAHCFDIIRFESHYLIT